MNAGKFSGENSDIPMIIMKQASGLIKKVKAIALKCFAVPYAVKEKDYSFEILFSDQKEQRPFLMDHRLPAVIANGFEAYNKGRDALHVGYIYRYKGPAFIEPKFSWVVGAGIKLLRESQPYPYYGIVSYFHLLKPKKRKVEKVVSLWKYHFNYYHFIIDILGQIALMEKLQLKDVYFTIPEKALQISYVKEIFASSKLLQAQKWIVQKKDLLIKADEIYLPKPVGYAKENIAGILDILEVRRTGQEGEHKIFLKRGSNRGRRLANLDAVEALVKKYDFQVIDTDNLTVAQQIALFSNTRYVIGIHGAGFTNIIFRKDLPLRLLELFPADYTPPYYYWICNELGFEYDAIYGSEQDKDGQFYIDEELLKKKLAGSIEHKKAEV